MTTTKAELAAFVAAALRKVIDFCRVHDVHISIPTPGGSIDLAELDPVALEGVIEHENRTVE